MPTEQRPVADDSLTGLAVFADPLRRRLYQAVVARRAPVTREEISQETGGEALYPPGTFAQMSALTCCSRDSVLA